MVMRSAARVAGERTVAVVPVLAGSRERMLAMRDRASISGLLAIARLDRCRRRSRRMIRRHTSNLLSGICEHTPVSACSCIVTEQASPAFELAHASNAACGG
jgi:hypothetical protein